MRIGLLLLTLVAPAWAGQLGIGSSGTLQACGATCQTGCSRDGQTVGIGSGTNSGSCTKANMGSNISPTSGISDFVMADGASTITFLYVLGTNTTMQVENSIDFGTTWFIVSGSSSSTNGQEWVVASPTGWYRTANTACGGGCTYTTKYHWVNAK